MWPAVEECPPLRADMFLPSTPPNRFLSDFAVRDAIVCFSFWHYLSREFLVKRIMSRLQIARELRLMGNSRTRHLSCPAKFFPPLFFSLSQHLIFPFWLESWLYFVLVSSVQLVNKVTHWFYFGDWQLGQANSEAGEQHSSLRWSVGGGRRSQPAGKNRLEGTLALKGWLPFLYDLGA